MREAIRTQECVGAAYRLRSRTGSLRTWTVEGRVRDFVQHLVVQWDRCGDLGTQPVRLTLCLTVWLVVALILRFATRFDIRLHCSMKKTLLLLGTVAVTMGAEAALTGPAWPPPGGVNYTMTGTSIGDPGGVTFSFSNFNPSQFNDLFWGLWNGGYPQMALDNSLDPLSFYYRTGGTAAWAGTTTWFHHETGVATSVQTILYAGVGGLGSDPWVLAGDVPGLDPGLGAVVNTAGGLDFTVNLQAMAWIEGDSYGYRPINSIPQSAGHGGWTRTEFAGGFYYTTPEAVATLPLLAATAIGMLALRRRRADG